jgi:hypothetical protein
MLTPKRTCELNDITVDVFIEFGIATPLTEDF